MKHSNLFLQSSKSFIENFARRALLFSIYFYRGFFSYFFGGNCRFYPTCSSYALDVARTHNFIVAVKLIAIRVSSCHPFGRSGFDPAPEVIQK